MLEWWSVRRVKPYLQCRWWIGLVICLVAFGWPNGHHEACGQAPGIVESDINADIPLPVREAQISGSLSALHDRLPQVKAEALYKLKELEAVHHIPEETIPELVALLEHQDSWVRRASVEALSELGKQGTLSFDQVKPLLDHDNSAIRAAAARVLSSFEAQEDVPLDRLEELLEDDDPDIRSVAVKSLGKQGERAQEYIPEIVEMLQARDWVNRAAAAEALGYFGAAAASEIPRIIEFLTHESWEVRSAAATTLGNIGEPAGEFLPRLEALLDRQDWEIRSAAATALGKLGPTATPAISNIAALLKDDSWSVRAAAARALGDIGEPTAAYVPQITHLLEDREKNVRAAAAWTLGNLGDSAVPALEDLAQRLTDNTALVRAAAVEALGKLGQEVTPYISQISTLLNDRDWEVRSAAAIALGNLGVNAGTSVPEITKLMDDTDWYVRSAATRALGKIGEPAKNALPKIASLLNDEDGNVRAAAVSVLGQFGRQAEFYRPEILSLLNDGHPGVRYSAIQTLGNLSHSGIRPVTSTLEPVYQDASRAYEYRFLAYLIGAGQEDVETLLKWIGQPGENQPNPEDLTQEEARQTLETFEAAWASTQSFPQVREDLARQIAAVASARQDEWTPQDRLLLEAHLFNLTQSQSAHAEAVQEIVSAIPTPVEEPPVPEEAEQPSLILEFLKQVRDAIAGFLSSMLSTVSVFFQEQQVLYWLAVAGGAHVLLWLILFLLIPVSQKIQRVFFWNSYVRTFAGLGYVHLLLSRFPFLGRRLFAPYRRSLRSDAALEAFDEDTYFHDGCVVPKGLTEELPLHDAIPRVRGQIILIGESGSGKTMFTRWMLQRTRRLTVFLPAGRCVRGVVEAIQDKLHGVATDKEFLQQLISQGAIDIVIDGLNEVSMTTQAKVLRFVQSEYKGNLLLLTQPIEWKPPASMRVYTLQPLRPEQLAAFLKTCYGMLPKHLQIARSAYNQACEEYVTDLRSRTSWEGKGDSEARIFSNPVNLSIAALLGAYGKDPNPERLQEQLYDIMAEGYARQHHDRAFPLARFAEHAYWTRYHDKTMLYWEEFADELHCMKQYHIVQSYESADQHGTPGRQWIFRHEKIMDFFVAQTFLGKENSRLDKHFRDTRFRGVYQLLPALISPENTQYMCQKLVLYASDARDPYTSEMFLDIYQKMCHQEKTVMTSTKEEEEQKKPPPGDSSRTLDELADIEGFEEPQET